MCGGGGAWPSPHNSPGIVDEKHLWFYGEETTAAELLGDSDGEVFWKGAYECKLSMNIYA